jgi:hypothetical protein
MKTKISCIIFLAFCLSLIGSTFGEIFIGNADFEDEPLELGDYTYNIAPWIYANASGGWPAWISYGYYADEPLPITPALYTEGCIVYQPLSATYEEGGIYNYSADVAIWGGDNWEIFLYDATDGDYSTPLVSISGPDENSVYAQWVRQSLTYVAGPAEAGNNIGVALTGAVWTMFDNVALEAPPGACLPDPYDSQINVLVDKTLSWHTGRDPNHPSLPNTNITQHVLYMSSASPDDPNIPTLDYVTTISATGDTAQYPPESDWAREMKYYWRVDELCESGPNTITITGDLWNFQTVGTIPAIDNTTPEDAFVYPGADAVFTVTAFNPFTGSSDDLTYQWYKVGIPDEQLTDGAEYAGTQTDSLTVIDVQVADNDEGQYYCVVTNTAGNTESNTSRSASLTAKKIVAWWKFDETEGSVAADSTLYGRDGTLMHMNDADWVAGLIDNCLEFDGADDYVAIQDLYYEGRYPEVTVCGWILTSESGDQIVASYDRNEYWRLEINGEGGGTGRIGWDMMTDGGQVDFGSSSRIDDAQWHFVTGVFDNGTITIYIDGSSDASTSRGTVFGSGNVRYGFLGVGSEGAEFNNTIGPERYFNGNLDDFRIYNYALQPLEIANLYLGVKPNETVCLSNPPMDISGPYDEPDCQVNIFDFAMIASHWMQCNLVPDCM